MVEYTGNAVGIHSDALYFHTLKNKKHLVGGS